VAVTMYLGDAFLLAMEAIGVPVVQSRYLFPCVWFEYIFSFQWISSMEFLSFLS
jgi:hypothetical protein